MSGDARGDFSGTTVGGGRYELRGLLGEGGMASVHFGYDTVLERPVAIKTLHSELGREASFRERFRREAQSVAKLNHTNIVSVFDSGEDEIDGRSVPYIVMELVDGKPLRQILDEDMAQHGAMPTDKALKITGDVLAALAVSHEMGLVHRDIKPGNVMLTKRGVVKVMDFGIARALQSGVTSMTQTGMVVGTPQYLSPEQALGRGVDARSDLYSVGCMLFELLTGRLPFDGDSPLSVAYQHVQEEPPAPSSINQSLPPAVDALVARALRKNPADRFPTADAMQDECERVAAAAKGIATPLVISEGPRAHQPATTPQPDAFAVFPNVTGDPHAQTPSPYQQQAPAPQLNYGPSTPPPNQYQQQPYSPAGYQTPPPATRPTASAYRTPPPAPRKSGGNWKPLLVFVGVAAVIGVVLVSVIASMNSKNKQQGNNTTTVSQQSDSSSSESGTGGTGGSDIKMGDPSRTVDASTCTQASGGFTDSGGKVIMPDLTFKYIDSVKACMDAAGWKYKLQHEDENVWGKGIVMSETPNKYSEFNPKSDVITLIVSTGKSSG
ncbi:Stk1 family PASTA domain-containing Ser/Thr kinase [Streptomyces sp. RPT161]|uniref:Stk1 family PASTA domain-containing Ser/Thr kinase n=1 Tax=Streptomyces sp. RPT161 TaxID=3015993 RepID=UPI0022B859DA|nr:Stk1 family PASTA domain-containing Ser/Thr kinase [Streptomyces sp. RPT161]